MAESFARTARRFFSPEALVPFLFGSIALGVLSNAAFTCSTALPGMRSPAKHRGLILLVSNRPTCDKAIQFHGGSLERVWLSAPRRVSTPPLNSSAIGQICSPATRW